MGSIDVIKPQTNVLSIAVNKSQPHPETNSRECRELNPWPLDAKRELDPFVLPMRSSHYVDFAMMELLHKAIGKDRGLFLDSNV